MKKITVLFLALFLVCCIGCKKLEKGSKHLKSNFAGLDRKVTLYDCSGKVIKEWQGKLKVEVAGGVASFIIDGKEVKISGIFTIEEQ